MNTLGWTLIESDEADSLIGPPRPASCPAGWTTHTWTVTIEEGRLAFTTDECDLCARGIEDLEPELIGGEFRARLEFHQTYGYYDPEIDVWFEVVPCEVTS